MNRPLVWTLAASAFFAAGLSAREIPLPPAGGWAGMKPYTDAAEPKAVKLVDKNGPGDVFLESKIIPLDANKSYRFSGEIKRGQGNHRAEIHIFFLDANNSRLNALSLSGGEDTQWHKVSAELVAGKRPENCAAIQLALQPAAGPTEETGTAWFRKLDLSEFKAVEPPENSWIKGVTWAGMPSAADEAEPGAVRLEDSSTAGGSYLESSPIKVDRTKRYRFDCEIKAKNVTTRAQAHIFFMDAKGNRIDAVSSNGVTAETWTPVALELEPEKIPQGTVAVKLALQPAAGPAEGTGTAWFRKVKFGEIEAPATLEGREIGKEYFYKVNRVNLAWENPRCTPFGKAPDAVRMEMYAVAPQEFDAIQFVTNDTLPATLPVALWNEEKQIYEAAKNYPLKKVARGYIMDTKEFGYRHRIAFEFPGLDSVTFDDVRAYAPTYPGDGWKAEWIWFTQDRVEDLSVWLRGSFELDKLPVRAFLQFAADDNGTLWLNGKHIGNNGAWHSPTNINVLKELKIGKNELASVVMQARYAAGFIAELDMVFADGTSRKVITSPATWRCTLQKPADGWNQNGFDDSKWQQTVSLGHPPMCPWGGKMNYYLNAPRKALNIVSTTIPATGYANLRCQAELKVSVDEAPEMATPVELKLKRNGRVYWEQYLGKLPAKTGMSTFQIDFPGNPFLVPGDYDLELCATGYEQQKLGEKFAWKVHLNNPRRIGTPNAKLEKVGNTMTLTIDGTPHYMMFSARRTGLDIDQHARLFGAAGMHLYHAYILPAWSDPETPDFGPVDVAVARVLTGDPQARIVLKMELRDCQPAWLLQKYPDEAVLFDNGRPSSHVSLASTVWRDIVDKWITGLVAHVAESPYADRIIGYFVYEGEEGQWMHYWAGEDLSKPGTLTDYGKPMQAYFKKWLKTKYKTDAALQAAWNDQTVTLDTAKIPSLEQRARGDNAMRDPVRDRAAIDCAEAHSDVISEGIEHYCKLVKDLTGGAALTGAMYGHIMDLGGHFLGESVGYLKQQRVIESPYVDVALGPISYAQCFRDVGGTASFDAPSPASMALHRKMWMNEDDVRTHLCFPAEYAYSIRTPDATAQMLAREVFKGLCGQAGMYFYSLGDSWLAWFDDPEIADTFRSLNKVANQTMKLDRSSRSEIAVFMDDFSIAGFRLLEPGKADDTVQAKAIFQRYALSKIGAPFDEYMFSDALNPDLPKYKLYIFLNPLMMTKKAMGMIKAKLENSGATAIWYYAPGVFTDKGLSTDFAEFLTGMDFTIDRTTKRPMAFKDVKTGAVSGNADAKVSPTLVPDRYDEVIAVWADNTNAPSVVRKGKSYFAALGLLSTGELREIARKAGVEILSENDIAVYANASLLAVHSSYKNEDCLVKAPQGKLMRMIWPEPEEGRSNPALKEVRWHNTSPVSALFELINQ